MTIIHTPNRLLMAISAVAVLVGSTAANSDTEYEVGAGINYFMFEDDFNVADDVGFRGYGGLRFDEHWGLELVWDKLATETDPTDLGFDLSQYYLSGLYHFNQTETLQPYLSLGWGQGDFEVSDVGYSATTTSTNIGAGLKWFVNEHWVVRPSINYFMNTEIDEDFTTLGLTLAYVWGGGSTPAPAPVRAKAPADTDGDGVVDTSDRCTATPAGVRVNAQGCPLDSDGDGVFDHLDNCPDTASRLKVDVKGCPMQLSETVAIDLKVNFDSNSDVVKAEYFAEIQRVADFLAQYEGTSVVIEGHTDTSGAATYNKALSQRRANAVAAVLVNRMNVPAGRVSAKGYGEERPIADESTRAGREANRRVVAKVAAVAKSMELK